MRELATQSASETLATDERTYTNTEFGALSAEVERIAQTTTFNGISLANQVSLTDAGVITIQVGANNTSNDRIGITLGDLRTWQGDVTLGISWSSIVNGGAPVMVSLNNTIAAQSAIDRLDAALTSVNQYRSTFGSIQNRLESAIRNLSNYTENLQSAKSRILDADFAHETAQLAKFQILQQSGVAVLGQANAVSQAALRLLG